MLKTRPIEKFGALRVKPNWRFEALSNPATIKLQGYISTPISDSSSLRRYLKSELLYEVNYKVPVDIKRYISRLSPARAAKLQSMWERSFKRSKQKKLSIDSNPKIKVWNQRYVDSINDAFLVRAVKHVSNIEFDHAIDYALKLHRSVDFGEIFKFIGYCIYAKIDDAEIAKRWNISVKSVTAIRMLFFDFTGFPKDRVANFTYLRQLANNGVISDIDFAYYKRVYELGELGLKAQTDFFSLTNEEKKKVQEYLGKSVISNTLNLNFSIRNQKDAHSYGMLVNNLATYYIKETEKVYFEAKTENLKVQTLRIEGSMLGKEDGLSDLDRQFIDILRENSLAERPVEYKTLDSLN